MYLVDDKTAVVLCQLFPLDRTRNADGLRRTLTPLVEMPTSPPGKPGIAPLLKKLMADYAATGLPPAYVPKDESKPNPEDETHE